MRILVVDADSKKDFANLAIMKISAHHKKKGDSVDLIKGIPTTAPLNFYDRVYLSCIFFQNQQKARDYLGQFPKKTDVMFGGSGFLPDFNVRFGSGIEHIMPDYDLYPVNYSMGFTSRGCTRNCKWCVVPKKEGKIKDHSPISEFHDPRHKNIILLDNNFQASPKWRDNIQYIIDHDLKVNYNQGLDARLLTDEFAELLAKTKFYSWNWKTRGVHFAFDEPKQEKKVRRAIDILGSVGIKPYRIMFYVLVGFNTTIEQDLHRIHVLKELGAYPYVMRYNQTKDEELYNLARWVNRRYYQFIEWSDYKR
jgi:hypothetical protein